MSLLPNTLTGLPALLGVLLGLYVYAAGGKFVSYTMVLLVAPLCLTAIGHIILPARPRLARWLIETCILSAIAATAFGVAIIAWISLSSPVLKIIDLSSFTTDQQKALAGVFLGAVTAYFALVWMKDIGEGKGFFWPSTQFKSAMGSAFQRLAPKPAGTSAVYQACFGNSIDAHGAQGWDFSARSLRADKFAAHLDAAAAAKTAAARPKRKRTPKTQARKGAKT